jgi:two-component system phosphate regulon response regulator OmpR
MAAHVLVVDDEADIRASVREYLEMNGFDISTADNAEAARRVLSGKRPVDLVILDVRMPGEDGITLARHLREKGGVGIMMLTASGEMIDRIVGYEVGADDYMTKPFDLRELLARVKSLARRLSGATATPAPGARRLHFGTFTLDVEARKLTGRDGEPVALTAMEFDLLKAFVLNPNRVLNRDQLLDLANRASSEPFDRSIDIRVTRLRRKIEPEPSRPRFIKTARGVGYVFSPDGT